MNNPKSIYNALICLFVFSAFVFAVNPSFAAETSSSAPREMTAGMANLPYMIQQLEMGLKLL